MSKKIVLSIPVETNAAVSPERVAEIVRRLIDAGLGDAQATIESGEGEVDAAELATDLHIGAPRVIDSSAVEGEAAILEIRSAIAAMYCGTADSEDTSSAIAQKVSKESLADFVVDAFNRGWITRFNLGISEDGDVI